MNMIFVYSTVPHDFPVEKIAKPLIQEKLAACVNSFGSGDSFYIYEDKFCNDKETVLIIKTLPDKLSTLKKRLLELHPYKVPCLLSWEVKSENENYSTWLKNACTI